MQKRLLSGFLSSEINSSSGAAHANALAHSTYVPSSDDGCPQNHGDNVKVNQNCLNISDTALQGRGQAQNETAIAVDPSHPDRLIATYNDYRRAMVTATGHSAGTVGRTGLTRRFRWGSPMAPLSAALHASTGRRAVIRLSPGTRKTMRTSAARSSCVALGPRIIPICPAPFTSS